jgi:hypothetical protein
MAGSPPRKCDDDGIMDFIPRHDLVKPIPRSMARFVRDYDIVRIGKMLSAPDGDRSFAEKWEYIKNVSSIASLSCLYIFFSFRISSFRSIDLIISNRLKTRDPTVRDAVRVHTHNP